MSQNIAILPTYWSSGNYVSNATYYTYYTGTTSNPTDPQLLQTFDPNRRTCKYCRVTQAIEGPLEICRACGAPL